MTIFVPPPKVRVHPNGAITWEYAGRANMEKSVDLTKLVGQLDAALASFNAARRMRQEAEREEGQALADLNACQKAIDEAVSVLRKGSPWNTRWANAQRGAGEAQSPETPSPAS